MADRPSTLRATDLEPATLDAKSPDATAVIVFHGMGQQVRWETIDMLVDTLDRHGHVKPRSVHVRQALFTDADGRELRLGRAECVIASSDTEARRTETHVYEAYWAPLTEGAVGVRDVVHFLFSAGWAGIRYAFRDFRRHVLGELRSYGPQTAVAGHFIAAMGFVGALVALNLLTAWNVGRYLMEGRPDIGTFVAPLAPYTHLLWNMELLGAAFAVLMILALLVKDGGRRRIPPALQLVMWGAMWALLIAVPLITLGMGAIAASSRWFGVPPWTAPAYLSFTLSETGIALAAWGGALVFSWYVKRVLVQYAGDVMVYVTAHQVNRFAELREKIQATAARVATTLYRQGGYKRYVFVGHSLGSVVAYDTLNRLILEETHASRPVQNVEALITFGSPLDKTAFVFRTQAKKSEVREAMAATVQPLIQTSRPAIPWLNLWSRHDIVSGEINFYATPGDKVTVRNESDPDADIPLFAHVQFWKNRALAAALARAANGAPALV
ncbi:MAG: hypothetical protein FJW14_06710 [Acidimicrobiia bacterium]|nr:hypothetical protein [Acidimicrobiia bacterium]